ncbi:hypothetical protein AUEXF2481DRAFT_44535 [Aureobasidium subglaciale EXF-2481]|uniref:Uncharacterized protein n=1 Tax=Aureobasidium subglaciale (strain EXF-2481) TaxID=1043005 RepID=A0A074XZJ9_AURSE|nr:uncharacterized protein AUEXF2481DRAFT_44535 [Aureobasidium subglaciale EXF-2481]KEQ90973.1 hypothetical protein AUEXF2481DRAFT_44535 [Aureobasidium subglaciale EXF-2481]
MTICNDSATSIAALLESLLVSRAAEPRSNETIHQIQCQPRATTASFSTPGKRSKDRTLEFQEQEIEFGFGYLQRRNGQNVCTNAALASL